MKKDKLRVYILELILVVVLFFTLFASNVLARYILAVFLPIYMVLIYFLLKKKGTHSIYKKQVTIMMAISGIIYLVILYGLGLYFGFVGTKVKFSWFAIYRFIVPLSSIIISSELIREKLLAQNAEITIKDKKYNVSMFMVYISMVLIDIIIYTGVYDLTNMEKAMDALGFVLFSSLISNLLFNYVSTRYGRKGIIAFRLITTLYIYIIPFEPDIFMFLQIFFKILAPYFMYVILESTYSKTNFVESIKSKRKNVILTTVYIIILILFIMLISCKFRFGMIVIGSRSMTGTIDVGDAVIYERYDNQVIEKGQVIIFDFNGVRIVHRVIDIRRVNGEYRYITKGDYNPSIDDYIVTNKNIVGVVNLRIKYIGKPTLWLRSLFE